MSDEGPGPGPGQAPLVLVVEDERTMVRLLRAALTGHGYRVVEASSGEEALRQAATRAPDVVVLDLGLPDLDGLEVTRRLREWSAVPIVVVSARGQEGDKIKALDAGADDYVTKPFSVGELLARMRVALRHAAGAAQEPGETTFSVGGLRIDRLRRQVFVDDIEVRLTPIEYRLLSMLAQHAGRVLTHEHLLRQVWGPGYTHQHHYLRVYMAQLRHKLEQDPSRPRYLLTEPGVGYRLREP
jgi:two-component system, OmpR family, KDP operon response regulator KdpE